MPMNANEYLFYILLYKDLFRIIFMADEVLSNIDFFFCIFLIDFYIKIENVAFKKQVIRQEKIRRRLIKLSLSYDLNLAALSICIANLHICIYLAYY